MFLALVFIVLGIVLLLNTFGIIVTSNFWGLFWAVILLSIGIKMLMRRGMCPICAGHMWGGKFHEKMHMQCCNEGECNEEECGDECECECEHKHK